MPSKTQHKIQFARERGVFVIKLPFNQGWLVAENEGVYPETHGPYASKRAAKNDAYRLAVGQAPLYTGMKE